jgi:hypothetical protein
MVSLLKQQARGFRGIHVPFLGFKTSAANSGAEIRFKGPQNALSSMCCIVPLAKILIISERWSLAGKVIYFN